MDNLFFRNHGILLKQRNFELKKVAFVFPGHGSQYEGMFKEFHDDAFRKVMQSAEDEYKRITGKSLIKLIKSDEINRPEVMQPAIFATEVAMFTALKKENVIPNILIGHSFGEISALCCGGVFDIKTGIDICVERANVLNTLEPEKSGFMIAVKDSQNDVITDTIKSLSLNSITVAIKNNSKNTIYSGKKIEILKFRRALKQKNINSKLLTSIPFPFHSKLLDKQSQEFESRLYKYHYHSFNENIEIYSTILGRKYKNKDINAMPKIIASQLITPFNFNTIVLEEYKNNVNTFIECGPGKVLTSLISNILELKKALLLNTNLKSENANFTFLRSCSEYKLNSREENKMLKNDETVEKYLLRATGYPADLIKALLKEYKTSDDIKKHFAIPESIAKKLGNYLDKSELSNDTKNMENLKNKVKEVVSKETGYPVEILEDNADLEADLGIDSVKLNEILSKISKKFQIDVEGNIKFNTIADINTYLIRKGDFIKDDTDRQVNKENTREKVKTIIEQLTGYPKDILEDNADFTEDLGIDLAKKKEIFNRVASLFGRNNLANSSADTIGELVESIDNASVNKSGYQDEIFDKNSIDEEKVKEIISKETGYPVEILEDNADLEADLGIDSVKKGEILNELSQNLDFHIAKDTSLDEIETIQDIITFFQKKK